MSKRQQPSKRENRQRDLQAKQFVEAHGPHRIQEQLGRLGFADVAGLFHPDGSLKKNIHDVPPELRAAIRGLRIREFFNQQGQVVATNYDYKLEPKRESLHDLAAMHGLLQEAPLMQMGLQININLTAPAYAAPGSALKAVPPSHEITEVSGMPVATVEEGPKDEPIPDEAAAPADPDAARHKREAEDYAAAVQRALDMLSKRPHPKPPFAITD